MSNLNSELIEEEEINIESVRQSNQTEGIISQLRIWLTSERRNLQNLSALVVFNFLAAGLFFLTQVKIANVIGKEQFGLLAYSIALGMYGGAIVQYGMNRTLVRDLIHQPDRFTELVTGSLLLRGVLFSLVIIFLVVYKYSFNSSGTFSWGLFAIVVAYSLKSLDLQSVYDAWHRMGRHAGYNLVQRGLYFAMIGTIIVLCPERLSLIWIGFGMLGTEIFRLFLQHKWVFRQIDFGKTTVPLACIAGELFKNGFWIWLASIFFLSFGSLNQIILKHFCGASELGIYAASYQVTGVVVLLLNQIGRIGNTATARYTSLRTKRELQIYFLLRYSGIMLITAAPICFVMFSFPEILMTTFFKPEYTSGSRILQTLSSYVMVVSIGIVASQYIVSCRMERMYFANVVIGGALSLILCVVLIPKLGGLGAALALLISHGTSMGLYWIVVIRHIMNNK